jgi:hypothetical protein
MAKAWFPAAGLGTLTVIVRSFGIVISCDPAPEPPGVRPLDPVTMRTLAAAPGADSTRLVSSPRSPTSATTPCSCRGRAATAIAPGPSGSPPGTTTDAVTGVLEVSTAAPVIPVSDGSSIMLAEPAGMSIAPAPVGS